MLQPSSTIKMPNETLRPMGVVVAPDGTLVFVSTGRGRHIVIVDTSSHEIVGSVDVGLRPWGLALSPDGRTLYTANGPSNDVSVVDVASRTVTARIAAGDSPWGVVFVP
jgi:YVTN family beta-propeller protein